MRVKLIVAGKPALPFTKAAVDDYMKRLSRQGSYEIITVKAGESASVSERLLNTSAGCYRIALDERGSSPTTRELAATFDTMEICGEVKTIAFLIGAADGHTEELRNRCEMTLSLSSMTLQHELALVVLLEQLYRIASIKAGSPYHRD